MLIKKFIFAFIALINLYCYSMDLTELPLSQRSLAGCVIMHRKKDILEKIFNEFPNLDVNFRFTSKLVEVENTTPLIVLLNMLFIDSLNIESAKTFKKIAEEIFSMVKLLIDHGADVNAKDNNNATPLHYACTAEILKLLLEKGANPNAIAKEETTILQCVSNNADAIKILLSHIEKTDTDGKNKEIITGKTTLHQACKNPEAIKLLLENGVPINALDGKERTVLLVALKETISLSDKDRKKAAEVVKILLARPDVNPIFHELFLSDAYKMNESYKLIKEAAKNYITKAITECDYKQLRSIIKQNIKNNIDYRDKENNNWLHIAAKHGTPFIIAVVFQLMPELAYEQNNLNETPVHIAASKGSLLINKKDGSSIITSFISPFFTIVAQDLDNLAKEKAEAEKANLLI